MYENQTHLTVVLYIIGQGKFTNLLMMTSVNTI
jgi:hypothetical protein